MWACDGVRMHLPYESRGRRRREMAELDPWWMQSIIDETRAEHPDLGKDNSFNFYAQEFRDFNLWLSLFKSIQYFYCM